MILTRSASRFDMLRSSGVYHRQALLEAASESRLEAFYVVAIHTGLRRGELLGLKWTDADLNAGTLTVRRSLDVDDTFKAPKNRAAKRTLKLTTRALDALKRHKVRQNAKRLQAGSRWHDHNLVFPNTVGKLMNAGTSTAVSFSRS
jgi:integrase